MGMFSSAHDEGKFDLAQWVKKEPKTAPIKEYQLVFWADDKSSAHDSGILPDENAVKAFARSILIGAAFSQPAQPFPVAVLRVFLNGEVVLRSKMKNLDEARLWASNYSQSMAETLNFR